jgi:hypothetical protein
MPVFDLPSRERKLDSLDSLLRDGPLIPVEISIPEPLQEWCLQQGFPVPPPCFGYALIDTGAAVSAIDEAVLIALDIAPIDSMPLSTPSGNSHHLVYPAKVSIPSVSVQNAAISRFCGLSIGLGYRRRKTDVMLLGRDLLADFLLLYNGPGANVTVAC